MKEKLKKLNEYEWTLPKSSRPGMNVDGKVIGNKWVIDDMDDEAIGQLANVAMMPGVLLNQYLQCQMLTMVMAFQWVLLQLLMLMMVL